MPRVDGNQLKMAEEVTFWEKQEYVRHLSSIDLRFGEMEDFGFAEASGEETIAYKTSRAHAIKP